MFYYASQFCGLLLLSDIAHAFRSFEGSGWAGVGGPIISLSMPEMAEIRGHSIHRIAHYFVVQPELVFIVLCLVSGLKVEASRLFVA